MRGKLTHLFSGALGALFLLGLAPNHSLGQTITGLRAVRVASGLSGPLFVTAPPGDYGRLFIVQKGGKVLILKLDTGLINATPFLDLSGRVATASEEGLVGLTFDPNYATNGKFYLYFVVSGGAYGEGISRISQFKVSGGNRDVADTSEEKNLISFDQPQANHNGGWIGFSPRPGDENNLYIASGDGGNGNDQSTGHIEPGGNAQNLTTLLGKMLRIHVDAASGTASIPSNNPFIGTAGARPEIFAYGLRNPFRNSFDRATGNLFIGDVGQDSREEVDVQKASNPGGGENYGWRLREGTISTPTGAPIVGGAQPSGGVNPIIDYPHSTGGSVTGGYIYRGSQIPSLRGTYIFADYVAAKIFALSYDGTTASNFQTITSQLFPGVDGFSLNANYDPASLGEDANGEIYIVGYGSNSVFKIVPATPNVSAASVTKIPGGSTFVSAVGVPFKTHNVQTTDTLVQQFQTITTRTADGAGVLQYEDPNPGPQRFYRFTYP